MNRATTPASRATPRYLSSLDIEATVAAVAPTIFELLADGVPRTRAAIVAALGERHAKGDVVRTLMRLAVTGRLAETGRKYRLPEPEAAA
jgi:hypothetical protein